MLDFDRRTQWFKVVDSVGREKIGVNIMLSLGSKWLNQSHMLSRQLAVILSGRTAEGKDFGVGWGVKRQLAIAMLLRNLF